MGEECGSQRVGPMNFSAGPRSRDDKFVITTDPTKTYAIYNKRMLIYNWYFSHNMKNELQFEIYTDIYETDLCTMQVHWAGVCMEKGQLNCGLFSRNSCLILPKDYL